MILQRLLIILLISVFSRNHMLPPAPKFIETFKEIATKYDDTIPDIFNGLSPEKRIFIYYIFRASLPGHKILSGQLHRHARQLIELFEDIFENQEKVIKALKNVQGDQFIEEVRTMLVYLWTNHSQYFTKEHVNEKRTPKKLGLTLLSKENLAHALKALGKDPAILDELEKSLYDETFEPSLTVENNIEASAVNMYSPGFSEQDYEKVEPIKRGRLNVYYEVHEQPNGTRLITVKTYKIGDVFSEELQVSGYWLEKARDFAADHPQQFDKHIVRSLDYLIEYITSGDEELFKLHSIEWLKTNSKIDYLFGFIESYKDPKSAIGSFEAEVTVKTVNLDALNEILPLVERQLPFPQEYKRENIDDSSALPNASINTMLFGSGDCGPLSITAAYCLPNYPEIRSKYGSKQIMYAASKGLGELLNPDLARNLFNAADHAAWLKKTDPEGKLARDIWEVHCILHETLGHGSGRLAQHTFKHGDPTIDGVAYNAGETLPVTSKNMKEFLAGMIDALEELRAEIIALYTSIFNFDELNQQGLYKEWPEKIGKEKMIEELILDMARTGLRRLLSQPEDVKEISGAHARANTVILHYLLDAGGIEIVKEKYLHEGKPYTVLGLRVKDTDKALKAIKELCIEVQRIKSTADTQSCKKLFEQYGNYVRDLELVKILRANQKAVVGDLKVSAHIFPKFEPVYKNNKIIDIEGSWPKDIVDQFRYYKKLMMSTE